MKILLIQPVSATGEDAPYKFNVLGRISKGKGNIWLARKSFYHSSRIVSLREHN